ncbi:MAG: dihydrolipoamide acetyltransferase family protein [Thermaerobacter sp.]|nr:dihydrolipoamide acetyltransferase family protein [Thermaerobacter sp.]
MAEQVLMPQLGESVTEGTIGQWLKHPGDQVEKYESLLEVLTDKVNAEVPSPAAGTVVKLLVEEGTTVPIGTPICELDTGSGEAAESAPADKPAVSAEPTAAAVEAPAAAPKAAPSRDGVRYSPAVRRLAAEHQVDPDAVTGTGAGGRVTRDDVLKFAESGAKPPAAAPQPAMPVVPAAGAAVAAGAPAQIEDGDTLEPVSQVRRVIAERMVRSKQTVPHAWLMVEADVTGLVALRAQHKDAFRAREGVPLTYLPFMLRAVVRALKAVPIMNAQWNGDQIVMKKRVNIGVAAATERGLVVPVVHDADEKNVIGLAKAAQDLTQRARNGRLKLEDLSGGTFTLDNTGAVGTVLTYPIINAPEVGIVTMESIVKRPVVMPGDAIAVRSMVNLCLSFDHRVVDGAEAALFVNTVKKELEALTPSSNID